MGARLAPGSIGPVWCWVGQPGAWCLGSQEQAWFWIILFYLGVHWGGWCLGLWQGWVLTSLSFPPCRGCIASCFTAQAWGTSNTGSVKLSLLSSSVYHFCAPPKCCNFMGMVVQIVQISMRHVQFHNLRDVTTTIHYFWYVHTSDFSHVFLYLWPQTVCKTITAPQGIPSCIPFLFRHP